MKYPKDEGEWRAFEAILARTLSDTEARGVVTDMRTSVDAWRAMTSMVEGDNQDDFYAYANTLSKRELVGVIIIAAFERKSQ